MLSYVFVGFFPATLIVVFFLLCGFLLFYNFSSYLVQSHLRGLADQARFLAQGTALEIQRAEGRDVASIIERRQANATGEFAGVSMAVVPTGRTCADNPIGVTGAAARPRRDGGTVGPCQSAGRDSRLDRLRRRDRRARRIRRRSPRIRPTCAPTSSCARSPFPTCGGRATPWSIDLPVHESITQQLRRDTGVEMRGVSVAPAARTRARRPSAAKPIAGRARRRAGRRGAEHRPAAASWATCGAFSSIATGIRGSRAR